MTQIMQGLPRREWLALGQVISERHPMCPPDYKFRENSTGIIRIGVGCQQEVNGRVFGSGIYYFEAEQ